MLRITFSNHAEQLRDIMLDRLAQAPGSPFHADEIIIPSAAMRRWVDLAITDRFGICSNVRFSFLARWLWTKIGTLLPGESAQLLSSPVMTWKLVALFEDAALIAKHPRLQAYLTRADAVMRYDFAARTAALLQQYTTYRPDWIEQWDRAELAAIADSSAALQEDRQEDQQWQAALWQRMLGDAGREQQTLSPALLQALEASVLRQPASASPATFHVFCLPMTPPVHMAALRALGRHAEIVLYCLNPCRQYWFESVDRQRLPYLAQQADVQQPAVGNRLLAAWGTQARAQIDLLLGADATALVDGNGFRPAAAATLLGQLQDAMLDLHDLAPASIRLGPADRSIECHVCHSLTRELEVLQDQLLVLFAMPNPPLPSQVLVVTPNLEDAAALIDTVFGSVPFNRRIPYTITGRAASHTNVVARGLIDLLALANSRVTAGAVFALLQQPVIGRRFGFDAPALALIHAWLDQSGIRWGLDAAHRARAGLPETDDCTFEDGMNRLFLGYALPATATVPFAGRVSGANIEGGDAAVLGRFWQCMQAIRALQQGLGSSRPAQAWHPYLSGVLDTFFAPDDDAIEQLAQVREGLRELHDQFRLAGVGSGVGDRVGDAVGAGIGVDVVRTALAALLDESARGGVPTGTVTFAGMSSLRNLPYRIVCAIGLNDGAFPGTDRALEFDLMPVAPRRGDRQRGSDDRNLFLDLILAARDRLYLSYTGRGVRDNAAMPPSVLVADLLDYLVPAIATDANDGKSLGAARARLLVQHPLQPFSLVYFSAEARAEAGSDSRLISANDDYCSALQHALASPVIAVSAGTNMAQDLDDDNAADAVIDTMQNFFSEQLALPDPEWHEVSLDQLRKFFGNPCRYLLNERLGLRIAAEDALLRDDEAFLPGWEDNKALAKRLLPLFEARTPVDDIAAVARAGNELPPGPMGDSALESTLHDLQAFVHNVGQASAEPCLPPHQVQLRFDLDGEPWRLSGAFGNLRASGLVRSRFDAVRTTDYLTGWIEHLMLNASLPVGVTAQTIWIGSDKQYCLNPCEDASAILGELLRLYRQGLRAPLHFFPKTAWEYIITDDLGRASNKWHNRFKPAFGEDQDVSYQLALRGIDDPLDDAFVTNAKIVFGPLLLCLAKTPE